MNSRNEFAYAMFSRMLAYVNEGRTDKVPGAFDTYHNMNTDFMPFNGTNDNIELSMKAHYAFITLWEDLLGECNQGFE